VLLYIFTQSNCQNLKIRTKENTFCSEKMLCNFCPIAYRKWLTLVGGFLICFANGAVFSMGNLIPYMISYMRDKLDSSVRYSDSKWYVIALSLSICFSLILIGQMVNNFKRIPIRVYIAFGSLMCW